MSHWTKEAIEALIDAYKARPSMYVPDSPNYHSRYLRRKYEEDLSKIVSAFRPSTTPVEIRNKIQGLRTSYLHERKKADRAEMLSLDETYMPSLWYFDKLKFLDKYMRPKSQINASLNAALLSPSGSSKFSHDSDEDNKLEIHGLIQEELSKNRNQSHTTDPLTTFDLNDDNNIQNDEDMNNDHSYIDEDLLLGIHENACEKSHLTKKKTKDKHSLRNCKKFKKKDLKNSLLLKKIEIPESPIVENVSTEGQIFGRYVGWVIDNISDPEITMNLRHKIMLYINEAEMKYRKTKNNTHCGYEVVVRSISELKCVKNWFVGENPKRLVWLSKDGRKLTIIIKI